MLEFLVILIDFAEGSLWKIDTRVWGSFNFRTGSERRRPVGSICSRPDGPTVLPVPDAAMTKQAFIQEESYFNASGVDIKLLLQQELFFIRHELR